MLHSSHQPIIFLFCCCYFVVDFWCMCWVGFFLVCNSTLFVKLCLFSPDVSWALLVPAFHPETDLGWWWPGSLASACARQFSAGPQWRELVLLDSRGWLRWRHPVVAARNPCLSPINPPISAHSSRGLWRMVNSDERRRPNQLVSYPATGWT